MFYFSFRTQYGIISRWTNVFSKFHDRKTTPARWVKMSIVTLVQRLFNVGPACLALTILEDVTFEYLYSKSFLIRFFVVYYPVDTRRWINVGLTLVHRLRRWINVKPTWIQRLVLLNCLFQFFIHLKLELLTQFSALKPFQPSRCIKASFYIIENIFDFLTTEGFRRKISMKLFYEYMVIFFNLSPTSSHLQALQVENCGSNSRLVVDEGDNGKFRTERVK